MRSGQSARRLKEMDHEVLVASARTVVQISRGGKKTGRFDGEPPARLEPDCSRRSTIAAPMHAATRW